MSEFLVNVIFFYFFLKNPPILYLGWFENYLSTIHRLLIWWLQQHRSSNKYILARDQTNWRNTGRSYEIFHEVGEFTGNFSSLKCNVLTYTSEFCILTMYNILPISLFALYFWLLLVQYIVVILPMWRQDWARMR